MSVIDVLGLSAGTPEAPAVVGRDRFWTYAELGTAVDIRCESLRNDEVEAGDRFPVVVHTEPAAIVELLALWRYGVVPIPISPHLTPVESSTASIRLSLAEVPTGTQVVLRTSGTSGQPRGVAMSWANLEANVRGSQERLGVGSDDVWLATLAPGHVGWLAMIVRAVVLGGVIVMRGPMDAVETSDLLDGLMVPGAGPWPEARSGGPRAPTRVSLVPTQLHRILEYRGARTAPEHLRSALIGGAHTPASLVARALDRGWPLALTYGATEMSSQMATADTALTRRKPGTVGAPMPGVEVRVDEGGQLLARGATRALSYVGIVSAEDDGASVGLVVSTSGTAAVDAEHATRLADESGWYQTGDLGRFDEEGHLWITGRRIDRIVSGGVTVSAVEVEEALRAHPTVLDACVVGVPDLEWGERVGAWIEPVVGEFDLEELERHMRASVGAAMRPRVWHVRADLPRNTNGKVDRAVVRKALISSQGPDDLSG